jgi:hypothetical protein
MKAEAYFFLWGRFHTTLMEKSSDIFTMLPSIPDKEKG